MNALCSLLSRRFATLSLVAGFFVLRGHAAEFLATTWVPQQDRAVLVHVPEGTKRLRLQTRTPTPAAWKLAGIVHLEGRAGTLKLRLPDGVALEDVLVETSTSDPFPHSFYAGQTSFVGNASTNPGGFRGAEMMSPNAGADAMAGDTTVVEESDIWKWRDRTLYYFNSMRGLQVFDLSDFEHPRRVGGLRMPAVGEDMYLLGSEHVALLANRYDYGWNGSSTRRSEVVIVRHTGAAISEVGRVPVGGSFVESRLVGSTLYIVTQKVEAVAAPDGATSYAPKTHVYAVDLADPAHPVLRGPLDVTNGDGGWSWSTVVQATAEFLFVATDTWQNGAGTRSRVHAIDLRTPGQPLSIAARFDLRGQLLSKFQLRYADGILTTVSQAAGAVVETWDAAAAMAGSIPAPVPLDSLLVGANESLFGTRFDGDRVYVVTFRRIDPLFCVDLGDPRDLKLLGELEVPGFSTYLEAFAGGSRLLSVGVEGGRVAVSLFDVADPARPTMKSRVRFGDENHWSWSEANYDEKAIGFFQPEGLLVIPLAEWSGQHGYREGMQVVDATADGLRARGFIDHRFSARRGRLFDQTLVSIGSTDLVVVDLTDRDHPRKISSLTIAWPVQEALPFGDTLVQLESGDAHTWNASHAPRTARLRIAPKADQDALTADVDLGIPGEVAGATIEDDRVYVVLRHTEQRVIDDPAGPQVEWNSVLTTVVINLAGPDGPRVEGRAASPSGANQWSFGRFDAHWLSDGRLLWYPSRTSDSWFRCLMCPMAMGGVGLAADVADVGGLWRWWGGASGDFLVVDVADPANPRVVVREALVVDSVNAFASRAFLTANDKLLASWTTWRQDGNVWLEETVVQEIDLSDSAAPRRGPRAGVSGTLEGIHRTGAGGTVLFTSRTEVVASANNIQEWTWTSHALIDVLAYDGAQAFLLDSMRAEGSANMPAVTVGPHLLVALQPWLNANQTQGALHVLRWNETTGKLSTLPDIPLGYGWPSLQERGGFVFASVSSQITVVAAHQLPAPPATTVLTVDVPIWDQSSLVLDAGSSAAWQPAGLYGVEKLDLSSLPQPASGAGRGPRDHDVDEWHAVTLHPLDVVPAGGSDAAGPLPAGDDFRFAADADAETYSEWRQRYFTEPFGPSSSVISDPDHDGFDNYSEWAFDTSPLDPHSAPGVTAALVRMNPGDPERLVLIARVNPLAEVDPSPIASYLSLEPEMSTDLSSWRNVREPELEVIVSPVRRMYVLPAAAEASAVFGRLRLAFYIEG